MRIRGSSSKCEVEKESRSITRRVASERVYRERAKSERKELATATQSKEEWQLKRRIDFGFTSMTGLTGRGIEAQIERILSRHES